MASVRSQTSIVSSSLVTGSMAAQTQCGERERRATASASLTSPVLTARSRAKSSSSCTCVTRTSCKKYYEKAMAWSATSTSQPSTVLGSTSNTRAVARMPKPCTIKEESSSGRIELDVGGPLARSAPQALHSECRPRTCTRAREPWDTSSRKLCNQHPYRAERHLREITRETTSCERDETKRWVLSCRVPCTQNEMISPCRTSGS